jgi:hypothetical protein
MTQAWKGKEKEMPEMYGTWEKKFQQLLNWNVAVMENSHDSVIEMDVHMVGYKMYFLKKKIVHLVHVLRVFGRVVALTLVQTQQN